MKSRFAKVAYGVGNLGQALFFNTVQTFLIFFYTDVVRLDPKLVGLAFVERHQRSTGRSDFRSHPHPLGTAHPVHRHRHAAHRSALCPDLVPAPGRPCPHQSLRHGHLPLLCGRYRPLRPGIHCGQRHLHCSLPRSL